MTKFSSVGSPSAQSVREPVVEAKRLSTTTHLSHPSVKKIIVYDISSDYVMWGYKIEYGNWQRELGMVVPERTAEYEIVEKGFAGLA